MSDHGSDTFSPSHYRSNRTPLSDLERGAYDALMRREASVDETLIDEAFDIATRDLDDQPEELRRLRRARRHLHSVRRGVYNLTLADDLWLAAQVIARVLEADLGLDELETVALFDAVGLPVDAVPHYEALAELRTPRGAALGAIASDLAAFRSVGLCPRLRTRAHDCSRCELPDDESMDDESIEDESIDESTDHDD